TPEGAALVRKLAASADVLVENFKVGGLKKAGLDAEALRQANPRLIYASITGFGQDGPYADRAGYDYIIQGMGGLMRITGLPNRAEIVRLVSECIRRKSAAEWLDQLEAAGIPAGPINSVTQALSDVQAQHRGMVRALAGMPLVGSPVRLDGARADSELPPPRLG